ncbi:MAG TPA: sn-glycerol-3-phosphate ABC transporter ATP-binding protein UgpC [Bacillota bacterium]
MASITLDRVSKRYRNVTAVREVNLQIPDQEFVVLVGPSGCGKSTTLRMIAGLEEISDGTIAIGDRVVNDVPPKDRDVAMVFQNYALYPHMTVYDNMAFGLRLRRYPRSEIDRRVRQAAEMLDIGDLLKRRPGQLSGGQRQRVALGRAIVREPSAFLMDEPLSNLDAQLRVQMRAEISKLHQRVRTTTVYVTHDQIEAMTMGDRIVVMNQGVVQQVAPPRELYERPANVFVAGFIGSPPMNLFPARWAPLEEGVRIVGDGLVFDLPAAFRERVAAAAGERLVVGIRPEAISLHGPAGGTAGGTAGDTAGIDLPGTVEVVEPLGAETYVHARVGRHRLIARVPGDLGVAEGEAVRLTFPPERVYLFDAESEAAL